MASEIIGNRYKIEKSLGSGVCGVAYLTSDLRSKNDEKFKVVKKIYVGSLMMEETVSAAHEGNVLKNLSHENILKFYDSFVEKEFYCIVTEFCDEGDLDGLIQCYKDENKRFPEELVINWLIEILLAVQYIHLRNILHRDLKTKNIFLKNNQVKLGDFGIAKLLANPVDMAETFVGTPFYMSPEVLRHESYNSKSDIWSVGCILYDLVALEHPFKGTSLLNVVQNITAGPLPEWPPRYSAELKHVFLMLTDRNQSLRPSATQALATTFLSKHLQKQMNSSIQRRQDLLNTTTIVRRDKQNLEQNVQRKMKLGELQREAEEKLLKNLLPRDRMRVMRQRKADEEAQKLKNFVAQYHKEAQAQYSAIRNSLNPYLSSVRFGCEDNEPIVNDRTKSAETTLTADNGACSSVRRHLSVSYEDEAEGAEEVKEKSTSRRQKPLRWTTAFEEQPVTPMKDLSIYKIGGASTFDDDGIPENPELAETYYGQFDEFDASDANARKSPSSSSSSSLSSQIVTSEDDDEFMENLHKALSLSEHTIVKK